MAKQTINLGTPPTGSDGDTTRTALSKCASNFDQLMDSQAAGFAWITPSGAAGAPVFRRLVAADIPSLSASYADLSSAQTIGGAKTFSSNVTVNGTLDANGSSCLFGTIQTTGIRSRNNVAYGVNYMTFEWTGGVTAWVDGTNVGTFATTSDYRIKTDIESVTSGDLDAVMSVEPRRWKFANIDLWQDDAKTHRSFIAHEVQAVAPEAVNGEKDATDAEGRIAPQTLDALALISVLWGALREEVEQRKLLEDRIAALENAT